MTWNPDNYVLSEREYARRVRRTRDGVPVSGDWSVGNRRGGIHPQIDSGYLVRQHRERGIVAHGCFASDSYPDRHWADGRKLANYAHIAWTTWLPVDERLSIGVLKSTIPTFNWDRLQAGGIELPPATARALHELWEQHLASHGLRAATTAEEVPAGSYIEGAVRRIEVNRYERDARARAACIDHWGLDCTVCRFNFADRFGSLGSGVIHVHHVKELSTLGPDYEIDPIADLRPVCANCHTMLHRERPAMSIEELRRRLR